MFLDVDGVLNYSEAFKNSKISGENNGTLVLCDKTIINLNRIVSATDAKIVVSSSWRKLSGYMEFLKNELAKFKIDIYDVTGTDKSWIRGREIKTWLQNNPQVTSFVILDDDTADIEPEGLSKYHVKTSFYERGLEDKHVESAIRILNKKS